MQLLNFVLDTQAPAAPSTALDPVSDTGTFNNDNITNDNNLDDQDAVELLRVFRWVGVPLQQRRLALSGRATVQLFRTPVNANGTPIVVQTATATATTTGGTVTSIAVTEGGAGYTNAPGVTITGGGGIGATVIAVADQRRRHQDHGHERRQLLHAGRCQRHRRPGTAVLVNTLTNTAGGVVQIADINQSIPALLQTPGAVIPDGTYVYSAS